MKSVGESTQIGGITHELVTMQSNEKWDDIAWRIAYEDHPIKLDRELHIGSLYWVPYYCYQLKQIRERKMSCR
jgi:hypothetical protein